MGLRLLRSRAGASSLATRRLIEIGIVSELCRRRDTVATQDLRDHLLLEDEAHQSGDHERMRTATKRAATMSICA
jgi:DNA-binding GntR family transcriptional regulator